MAQLSPIKQAMFDLRARSREQLGADADHAKAIEKAGTELIDQLERLADAATRDPATTIERNSSAVIEFGTAKAHMPSLRITTDRSKPPFVQVTIELAEDAAKLHLLVYELVVITPHDPDGVVQARIARHRDEWMLKYHRDETRVPLTAESVAEAILAQDEA